MRLDTLRNSPITRTELFYQQRVHAPRKSWRRPLFYTLMNILAVYSIVVGVMSLSGGGMNEDVARVILSVFYLLMTILHFRWMLRTLTLASASVTREKRDAERWEALLLTGVSGREIVLGKWWATIKTMWRRYLFLAFVRAAVIITLTNVGSGIIPMYFNFYRNEFSTNVPKIVLGVVFVAVLTLANLPFTAACGVMAAMETKRGSGLGRALAARTAFTIIAAILPMLAWTLIGYPLFRDMLGWSGVQTTEISNSLSQYMSIMLDNGMGFSSGIIANNYWVQTHLFAVVLVMMLTLATYAGLTWALLRFAQWRAERTGALKSSEQLNQKNAHS